jgi:hypothetical protein
VALWRDGVSITVEVAFASDPLATSPTWTDITAYVREVPHIFRGRRSEYNAFAPSTCRVVLDNNDRRFDPDYAAGAYDPNVVPMKRLKVTWAFAAASGVVFTGFVLGWPQQERGVGADGFSTITAVDGSRFLEQSPLPESAYREAMESTAGVSHYWPLQDDTEDAIGDNPMYQMGANRAARFAETDGGLPIGDGSGLHNPIDTIGLRWQKNSPTIGTIWGFEFWAFLIDGVSGTEFQHNDNVDLIVSRTQSDGGPWHVTWRDDADLDYSTDAVIEATEGLHHWAFISDGSDFIAYRDGLPISTTAMDTPSVAVGGGNDARLTVGPGEWVGHLATYSAVPTAATIMAHYLAGVDAYAGEMSGARLGRVLDDGGWSASLRDIDTGSTPQAPYLPNNQTMMAVARQIERSEQALMFSDVDGNIRFIGRQALWAAAAVATLSDDGLAGDLVYQHGVRESHVDTVRNIVTASWQLGGITRRDATSITAYGEQSESIDSPTVQTAELASNLAAYVLREDKDPHTKIDSVIVPVRIAGGTDNECELLLAAEIGDKLIVERTPVGVSPQVIKTVLVQGIEHRITATQWTIALYLSPAPTSSTDGKYLTIGDATLGRVGTAANVVPF